MKTKLKFIIMAVAAGLALAASAGNGFYFQPGVPNLLVSSSGGPTNQVVTNAVWPSYITANTSVTNVTFFPTPGKDVAIQFTAQATTTNGGAVILSLGRSVQLPNQMPAGGITNANGSGLNIEWFATVTNTLPSNTATTAQTVHALIGPVTGYNTGAGEGGITTMYIGYINPAANVTLTNYSVWVNSQ